MSVWPIDAVPCGQLPTPPIGLYVASGNEPLQPVASPPRLVERTINGARFPTEEFDDIPADLWSDPAAKYTFVTNDGVPNSNVWVHSADGRTIYPHPLVPMGYVSTQPSEVDTRIQIVWPHDEQGRYAPVDRATLVNIAVDIFAHGTARSLPPSATMAPMLWIAVGNDTAFYPYPNMRIFGQKTTYVANGQVYPRWEFDDVPVQPGFIYHFVAITGALGQPGASDPNVWTHAPDARTQLPSPQVPPACTP